MTVGLVAPIYRPTHEPALSAYQTAQKQTVQVVSPDGAQGSAVVIIRGTRVFAWTAAHVVDTNDAVTIRVQHRYEGHKTGVTIYSAKVLGRSEEVDIALLQIDADPSAFPGAVFASYSPAAVGDPVFACGNFLGRSFEGSLSTGVISQIGVDPGPGFNWPTADQTTCIAFPGSSGGPLYNARGEVLGLVVGGINSTFVFFVPVRAISDWARINGFGWAVTGSTCPSDAALR